MSRLLNLFAILLLGVFMVACMSDVGFDNQETAVPVETDDGKKAYEELVVGYSQIGAESEWRIGNTASLKEAAEDLGVELMFSDGQQQQENQIRAIRTFIAQQVDVIGVSPVVETGWDSVFQEAKDAGIPIILVDRRALVSEESLYDYLGSDFIEEGESAARVMVDLLEGKGKIVELSGTIGSAPAVDRYSGLGGYPELSRNGNYCFGIGRFYQGEGGRSHGGFMRIYGDEIDAVYAHNDDMAIGAIQAIEDFGLKPGEDIKIVSIDAIREAFQMMIDGKLNATIECNPLLGPQFFELALKVVNGESVPKWIPSEEGVFFPEDAAEILPSRRY